MNNFQIYGTPTFTEAYNDTNHVSFSKTPPPKKKQKAESSQACCATAMYLQPCGAWFWGFCECRRGVAVAPHPHFLFSTSPSSHAGARLGVQKLTRSGWNGVSERDFWKINLPFSRLIKSIPKRRKMLAQRPFLEAKPCPSFPWFLGFIKEKPQIYQGFSALTKPTKSLENTEKTLNLSKEIPCLKLTKEIQTTKERKDREGPV